MMIKPNRTSSYISTIFMDNKKDLERRMEGALASLSTEFSGLRTGRASVNLLDSVMVPAYGSTVPLNQVASVTVSDNRMLSVNVWDKSVVGATDRAIRDSGLGLNPVTDGQNLRIPIPPLNEERRIELQKVAGKYAEATRVAIRNIRRDGMDALKKMEKDGEISEDRLHSLSDEVQKLTDQCVIDHYTAANFTPLYDKSTLKWSNELSEEIIDITKLPELKWSTEIAGNITKKASAETGLPIGIPVTVGTIDAAAEAISVGVRQAGDMMVMYGSTMFFIGLCEGNKSEKSLWSAPWLFENEFALMAGTSTSGTITQWFKKEFAKDLDSEEALQVLSVMAEKSPIGSKNLITLPYFSGERTPIQDPNACGIIFGLNLTHKREDIYRSIIEGISYGASHIIATFIQTEKIRYPTSLQ